MEKTTDTELKERALHAEMDKAQKILDDAGLDYILTTVKIVDGHALGRQSANVHGMKQAAYLLEKTTNTVNEIGGEVLEKAIGGCGKCDECNDKEEGPEKEVLEDVDDTLKEKRVKYAFDNFLEKLKDMIK